MINLENVVSTNYSFKDDAESALAEYKRYGFHIEENVFTAEECQLLIDSAYGLQCAKEQIFKPAMMPHRENPEAFLPALKKKHVVDIIECLVGGNAVGLQSTFFFCPPETRGFSLHQDNFFLQANYGVFASAWIALVDTSPTNGGLIIYPGTHLAGDLPVKKLNLEKHQTQDPNANNEETDVPPEYKPMSVSVKKGSVLFIHGHLVHGSHSNETTNSRYVLLNTYVKQGEQFRSGNYAQREPIPLI